MNERGVDITQSCFQFFSNSLCLARKSDENTKIRVWWSYTQYFKLFLTVPLKIFVSLSTGWNFTVKCFLTTTATKCRSSAKNEKLPNIEINSYSVLEHWYSLYLKNWMQRLYCAFRWYTFKWRKDIVQDNTPVDAAADVAQCELDNANTQARSYRECRN